MDRRRGSPPPGMRARAPLAHQGGGFRDPRGGDPFREREFGRGGGGGGGVRRGRSQSPVYDQYQGRRGPRDSPPPYNSNKRYRRDEPSYDRFGRDGSPGPYRGGGGPRSPPRGYRGDPDERPPFEEAGPRDAGEKTKRLLTFKEFMLQQPDDPSPQEAQIRYKQHTVEFHGGEIKADFAEKKNDEATRLMFDPRMFEKALARRNEEAREAAQQFQQELEAGRLEPSALGFNQGMFELAPAAEKPKQEEDKGEKQEKAEKEEKVEEGTGEASKEKEEQGGEEAAAGKEKEKEKVKEKVKEKEKVVFAPAVCWRPARVAVDLALARKLVEKLDAEKGIAGNALLGGGAEAGAGAGGKEGEEGKEQGKEEGGKEGMEVEAAEGNAKPEGEAAEVKPEEPAAAAAAVAVAAEAAPGPEAVEADLAGSLGRLDVLLTYLWRVHGLDYYAGYELSAAEFPQRLSGCRILRGACPPEGGEGEADEAEEQRQRELVEQTVNGSLERRLQEGDPLEAKCQRKRVEDALEKWVEDQVIMHAEGKWGNKLSSKMFIAKKFALKHIRSKHDDKLQLEKDRVLDEIYFENFKAFAEEEAKALEAHQQGDIAEGAEGGHGGPGGPGRGRGARGRGAMGGRAGVMGRMGRGGAMVAGGRGGVMPMGMMDMAAMGAMMPMGGPMMVPGMGPMIMIPAGMGPMMAPMMAMGGRGMRGGRFPGGPARGGRGGRFGGGGGMGMSGGGGGGREYYDLDNPQNNRAVLDYGDL